jgi:hypothetical protein
MTSEFDTTVELNDGREIDVTVAYSYSPGTPDVMYLSNGDPGYPGDGAEAEVLGVFACADEKRQHELSSQLSLKIIESLNEQIAERAEEAECDAYERAMEDKADAAREREWDL